MRRHHDVLDRRKDQDILDQAMLEIRDALRTLAATPPDRVVVAVSDLAALRAACSRAAALLNEAIVLDCADGSIGEDGLADVRRELVAALARLGEGSDG